MKVRGYKRESSVRRPTDNAQAGRHDWTNFDELFLFNANNRRLLSRYKRGSGGIMAALAEILTFGFDLFF